MKCYPSGREGVMTTFREKHGMKVAWAVVIVVLVAEQYCLPILANKWMEWVYTKIKKDDNE